MPIRSQISVFHAASVAVILASFAAFTGSARADLIQNGGFELPDIEKKAMTFNSVGQGIPGWTITKGSVQIKKSTLAYQGDQYLALNGMKAGTTNKFVGGTISQTFHPVKNAVYELSFAYANTPYSTAGAFVSVAGTTLSAPQVVSHSGATPKNLNWTLFSQDFTALSNTATLTFAYDPAFRFPLLLDAVSVTLETAAVPEPSGEVLLLTACGLAGVIFFRRRRTRLGL